MAVREGLAAIALCDHDNIDGVEPAQRESEGLDIEVLAGVEMSVQHREYLDIHLLGYCFDPGNPELTRELASFRQSRESRNAQIVDRINERLRAQGKPTIDFARVAERAGGTVGRPHIAMELIEKKIVANQDEAFNQYLVPCNVEKTYFDIEDAIGLIHRAGGIAVLAHPPFITRDRKELLQLIDLFRDMGLDGVEAYNNGSVQDDVFWLLTQCRRRGLAVTGGSDYHGVDDGLIQLGAGRGSLPIPYSCVEDIRRAMERRFGSGAQRTTHA